MNQREVRKRRRERILHVFKEHYCRPFYIAVKRHDDSVEEIGRRLAAFRIGVCMADPHGRWHKTFIKACNEVMKEEGITV